MSLTVTAIGPVSVADRIDNGYADRGGRYEWYLGVRQELCQANPFVSFRRGDHVRFVGDIDVDEELNRLGESQYRSTTDTA